MTFGVISDTHYHPFSAFAKQDGLINSRLQILMDETRKAAIHMKDAGCTGLYHCGDIFHVRGRVAPSVLNPVTDLYHEIVNDIGLPIYALAGNHDLEFENSNRIGNSGTALGRAGITIVSEEPFFQPVHNVLMIPWHAKQRDLLAVIENWIKEAPARFGVKADVVTLMIHAPVNEIIPGLPDHGIDPDALACYGFKRVFVGHYHNFKQVRPGVFSVGALTHQNWGDVNSKAGYLIVKDHGTASDVQHFETDAPKFIDMLDIDLDDTDLVAENYVRARIEIEDDKEVVAYREMLVDELGAAAALILPVRKEKTVTRKGAAKTSLDRLEDSITHFITASASIHADLKADVNAAVLTTLAEVDHAV